jgi:hypothetical protein
MPVNIAQLENSAAGRALELISATNLNKFVDFTSGLVREVFKTLISSTLEQLDAYAELVATVSGTLQQYEEKAVGDVDAAAVDYLNKVVLPSFEPAGTSPPQQILATSQAATLISLDSAKKNDLIAFFGGVTAQVVTVPTPGPTPTPVVGDLDTFDRLLVENTTATPPTLQISVGNLKSFAAARLRRDLKLSYEKLVAILKLGMQKIVVTEGRINTALTFHVTSQDADERTASDTQVNASTRAFNWALGGGMWGTRSLSGTIQSFVLSRNSIFSFSGSVGGSNSNTSTQVSVVNEKSTATTTLAFDITGSLELKFRSDFFPSFDPTTVAPPQ